MNFGGKDGVRQCSALFSAGQENNVRPNLYEGMKASNTPFSILAMHRVMLYCGKRKRPGLLPARNIWITPMDFAFVISSNTASERQPFIRWAGMCRNSAVTGENIWLEIIVDIGLLQTRVVLEDGEPAEIFIEGSRPQRLVGNI